MTHDFADALARTFADHEVVDLTLPLAEELPCTWPGHMPYRATVWTWFADRDDIPQPVHPRTGGSYQTRWLVMDEHVGTHLDAPRHVIPPDGSGLPNAGPAGAVGIDRLPLLSAAGPAAVVDVTDLAGAGEPGTSPPITPEHFESWEAEHGGLLASDVVLLRSGWDARYQAGPAAQAYGADVLVTRGSPGWPAPTPKAIDWLHQRGVRCIGTDGLSIGPAENGGPTHVAGLSRGMVFVEALTRLDALPPRGAWFLFLPLPIVAGTGAPGRAIAVLPTSVNQA
jgi:kynurenine formamidase